MNEEARKIWNTAAGASLWGAMLKGDPLTSQQQATVQQLKQADPPTKPQPTTPAFRAPPTRIRSTVARCAGKLAAVPRGS